MFERLREKLHITSHTPTSTAENGAQCINDVLPPEILSTIFSYSDLQTVSRKNLVCHKWKSTQVCWKSLLQKHFPANWDDQIQNWQHLYKTTIQIYKRLIHIVEAQSNFLKRYRIERKEMQSFTLGQISSPEKTCVIFLTLRIPKDLEDDGIDFIEPLQPQSTDVLFKRCIESIIACHKALYLTCEKENTLPLLLKKSEFEIWLIYPHTGHSVVQDIYEKLQSSGEESYDRRRSVTGFDYRNETVGWLCLFNDAATYGVVDPCATVCLYKHAY